MYWTITLPNDSDLGTLREARGLWWLNNPKGQVVGRLESTLGRQRAAALRQLCILASSSSDM